ncbi:MAG: sugar phosphate isomerase/epimerase family protein [Bacteroidales bacterium]
MKSIYFLIITVITLAFTSLSLNGQNKIKRKGEARIHIGLNAYSFNNLLTEGIKEEGKGMTLFDLLDFCAENDIDALDPTGYYFPGYPDVPNDEYIYELKLRAHNLGIAISGTGVRTNFANPDPEARAADIQLVKDWIEVAAKLGAPVLRVFPGNIPDGYEHRWHEVALWTAESIKECADYGKARGVIIGVQNHGGMLRTADQCIEMLNLVGSNWAGLVLDTYYFMTDDPYAEIERMIPYAVNWQLKERTYGGDSYRSVDLEKIMRIINRGGYRGYVPVETLQQSGRPYEPLKLVPDFVSKVRNAKNAEFE